MKHFQRLLVEKGFNIGAGGDTGVGDDGIPGKLTKTAAFKFIRLLCVQKGYKFIPNNPYWFRMSDTFTDKFSDICVVVGKDEVISISKATTKPGRYGVYNPLTVGGITGVGCIVAGQYIDSHIYRSKGKSKWGASAGYFEQITPIKVHRDGNKDLKLDKNIIQHAPNWYGFFFHAMGNGLRIWNWSLGCLGQPFKEWRRNIDPYFYNGQKVSCTIFEI